MIPVTIDLNESLDAALMPASLRDAVLAAESPAFPPENEDIDPSDFELDWKAEAIADADYLARSLSKLRAKDADVDAVVKAETARIEQWAAEEKHRRASRIAWRENQLLAFHKAMFAADPKHAITVNLPGGNKLESTAGRVKVEIDDEAAVIEWLQANERADEIRMADPEVDKVAFVKAFGAKALGPNEEGEAPAVDPESTEVIPGVRLVRGPRTYKIK